MGVVAGRFPTDKREKGYFISVYPIRDITDFTVTPPLINIDIILSSQVVSLPLRGCKRLSSNGHLDRSRCIDIGIHSCEV